MFSEKVERQKNYIKEVGVRMNFCRGENQVHKSKMNLKTKVFVDEGNCEESATTYYRSISA